MKAEQAIEGHLYNLKAKGEKPAEKAVECYGFNWDKSFMRFLVFDSYGKRGVRMVLLNEEIDPA